MANWQTGKDTKHKEKILKPAQSNDYFHLTYPKLKKKFDSGTIY